MNCVVPVNVVNPAKVEGAIVRVEEVMTVLVKNVVPLTKLLVVVR